MSEPVIHDLAVRDQLDATGLTRLYLDGIPWRERDLNPVVQPEVTPVTDSLLLTRDVILYHCGPPAQPDWNQKAWIWRYTLNLTVLGRDPERVFRTCAYLNHRIAMWPHLPGYAIGKIGRLVDNPGFEVISTGDTTSSKSVVAWRSTKLIQAASPR